MGQFWDLSKWEKRDWLSVSSDSHMHFSAQVGGMLNIL